MPKQLIILGLVLLLYFCPWQLFSGDRPADWLASVITMQISFVMACNFIVHDKWILPVIIIEAVSMMFNIIYVVFPGLISGFHQYIMIAALIMEILLITTSMGVINGRADSYHLSLAGGGLRRLRGGLFSLGGNKEGLQ